MSKADFQFFSFISMHGHIFSAKLWLEKYFNCFGPFSVGTADETLSL